MSEVVYFTRIKIRRELQELLAAARKELARAEAECLVARMLIDSLLKKIDEI